MEFASPFSTAATRSASEGGGAVGCVRVGGDGTKGCIVGAGVCILPMLSAVGVGLEDPGAEGIAVGGR